MSSLRNVHSTKRLHYQSSLSLNFIPGFPLKMWMSKILIKKCKSKLNSFILPIYYREFIFNLR